MMYLNFYVLMKVRHPGRNPGTTLLYAHLLCSVYLLFHTGISGRNPGTAEYLFFVLFVCRESSEFGSQSQSNVCHVKSSCDSTDARRNGSQEQRESNVGNTKMVSGTRSRNLSGIPVFTNPIVFYVGNSVSQNSDCLK